MNNQNVFRMNKNLFYINVAAAILLCFVIIGIPILIGLLLRYHFSSITVSETGLDYKKGMLNVTHKQIPYSKINTIDVKVDPLGSALGYGSIRIFTGNDVEGIKFAGIERPHDLKRLVEAKL